MKRALAISIVLVASTVRADDPPKDDKKKPTVTMTADQAKLLLKSDPRFDAMDVVIAPPTKDANGNLSGCSGFGLLTPLFGVSNRAPDRNNPNQRRELRVTGPVESGIGGGYFTSLGDSGCSTDFVADWEVFGFSEGLNPATTFQVGVGTGFGITVFGKFQFGIALGYDLIRREVIEFGGVTRTYSNGLLEWNDVMGCKHGGGDDWACRGRNFTWLLTFGVATTTSKDTP